MNLKYCHRFIDDLVSRALGFKHVTQNDIKTSTVHVYYNRSMYKVKRHGWYGWIQLSKKPIPGEWFETRLAFARLINKKELSV